MPEVRIIRREASSAVFGGQELKLLFALQGEDLQPGRLYWSMQYGEHREIRRGETMIAADADAEVLLELPPVKEGVILPLALEASFVSAGAKEPSANYGETLWIFHENPFFERTAWLEEQKIVLFDPAEKTAGRLEKAGVPHQLITNLSALADLKEGLVIIGEGISLREERALPEIILGLAARGIHVLCLSPVDGEIPLPGTLDGVRPTRLELRRRDVIGELDKRLDADQWGPWRVAPAHRLQLVGQGATALFEVSDGDAGWPWLHVQYPAPTDRNEVDSQMKRPPGQLLVTTLPMIEHWDDGPTPRFLFARVLEYLANPSFKPFNQPRHPRRI